MTPDVRVSRVYGEPSAADGIRVLVDRVWPRGLSKDAIRLDDWAKDVAPSTELRKWYGHDPAKFGEFRRRYLSELTGGSQRAALGRLRALARSGRPVTLLTATRDVEHSQAEVLARLLQADAEDEGGESACYAHLVCPECGAVTTEGHRPGCQGGELWVRSWPGGWPWSPAGPAASARPARSGWPKPELP